MGSVWERHPSYLTMEYTQAPKGTTPLLFGKTLRELNDAAGAGLKVVVLVAVSYTIVIARSEKLLIVSVIVVAAFLIGALLAGRRDFKLAALYVSSVVLFAHVRAFADQTGMPVHHDYAQAFDKAAGLGELPTTFLQSHFYHEGSLSAFDWAMYVVYVSYFSVIHLLTPLVWMFKRKWFTRHVVMTVAVFWGGLLLYYLVPTAPPWLVADGEVHRVIDDIGRQINAASYEAGQDTFGTNPVAAMPSVHMAITVVVALTLWRLWKPLGVVGAVYASSMGLALVYLGEHFLVDVLAGAALAVGAYLCVTVFEPQLSSAFQRIARTVADAAGRWRPGSPEAVEPFAAARSSTLDVAVDD